MRPALRLLALRLPALRLPALRLPALRLRAPSGLAAFALALTLAHGAQAQDADTPDANAGTEPAPQRSPTDTTPTARAATTATSGTAGTTGTSSAAIPEQRGGIALSLGAYLGGGLRLDDPPVYEVQERGGVLFGGTAALWPTSWLGVAVSFEHFDLGADRASDPSAAVDVDRDLNTLWGSLRLAPWSRGAVPYLTIGAGLAWQSLDAVGSVYPFPQGTERTPVRCEGSGSASLALRAGAGIEGRLEKGLVLFAEGGPDMIRLDDAPLDGCAAGAGTVMALGLRAGAQFRFDVTRSVR